jgi:hypothetical protein
MPKKSLAAALCAMGALSLSSTAFATTGDERPHLVVLVTTIADAPMAYTAEQRMLADLVGPLHVRLDRVHHAPKFVTGRPACGAYPLTDAILSVETLATFSASPNRSWPSLEKVPSVRWTPRDVEVRIRYAITTCGSRVETVSDRIERRYDAMTMREEDRRRVSDGIVRTAQALAPSVADRWTRVEHR